MMAYASGGNNVDFEDLTNEEKVGVLLGAPAGNKLAEVAIGAVKRYLRKAWKARRGVSNAINEEFDRLDVVWAKRGRGWTQPRRAMPTGPGRGGGGGGARLTAQARDGGRATMRLVEAHEKTSRRQLFF